jgi:hypothetical protein
MSAAGKTCRSTCPRNASPPMYGQISAISAESVTHPLRRNFIEYAAVLGEEASLCHAWDEVRLQLCLIVGDRICDPSFVIRVVADC